MMTICGWVFFILGVIGAVKLARQYTGRMARVLLTISGGVSLWLVLMNLYYMLLERPVPRFPSFAIFPIVSLIAMAIMIHKVPKIDSKEKRKVKE